MSKPCEECPWTSKAQRDKDALTPEVRAAVKAGGWLPCHVYLGTCFGAERYAKAKNK